MEAVSEYISAKLLGKKLTEFIVSNIDKVKIFCVLHDKVALVSTRYSEQETRNRHQRIFRKVLTMKTLIKR